MQSSPAITWRTVRGRRRHSRVPVKRCQWDFLPAKAERSRLSPTVPRRWSRTLPGAWIRRSPIRRSTSQRCKSAYRPRQSLCRFLCPLEQSSHAMAAPIAWCRRARCSSPRCIHRTASLEARLSSSVIAQAPMRTSPACVSATTDIVRICHRARSSASARSSSSISPWISPAKSRPF